MRVPQGGPSRVSIARSRPRTRAIAARDPLVEVAPAARRGAGRGAQLGRVRLGLAQPLDQGALGLGGDLGEVVGEILGQLVALRGRQVGQSGPDPRHIVGDLLLRDGHAAIPRSSSRLSMVVANERQSLPERVSWSRPAALSE